MDKTIFILALLLLLGLSQNSTPVWDEVISQEELKVRVSNFNKWYLTFNGDSKNVEARIREDGTVGLFATADINVTL